MPGDEMMSAKKQNRVKRPYYNTAGGFIAAPNCRKDVEQYHNLPFHSILVKIKLKY